MLRPGTVDWQLPSDFACAREAGFRGFLRNRESAKCRNSGVRLKRQLNSGGIQSARWETLKWIARLPPAYHVNQKWGRLQIC